jgi:hypothetical protein
LQGLARFCNEYQMANLGWLITGVWQVLMWSDVALSFETMAISGTAIALE